MTKEQYKSFQKFQLSLLEAVDKIFPIESNEGNKLFQSLSNEAFSFFETHKPKESPKDIFS